MATFRTHKQTVAQIYLDEAKLLQANIDQCKTIVQNIGNRYNESPKEEYLTKQENLLTEINHDQHRLETCVAISNWLLGKNTAAEDDEDEL